ncbi:MAG: hydrolase [Mangrovicoccus sp.]|nr:hydrolase [Mangrovicoccus sp.]
MQGPSDLGRFRSHVRWPGRLAETLHDRAKLIEAGQPGRTTLRDDPVEGAHKNGLAVLPALLESHRPLDVVIVMLGTNDLKARFAMTPWDIARGVERLVLTIYASNAGRDGRAPGAFLVSPVPILETGWLGEQFEGGAAKSRRLAPLIAEVAARHGCGFLDAGRHVAVDPGDGVHLSAEAHGALAAAMAEALLPLFG